MLKMKKWLAGLIGAAMLPATACAADAPPINASPAMWVVKDADTTIYMFGTFHMLDGKREWFNDEVKAAFDRSSELMLEAIIPENPAEMQPLIVKYATDPAGRTLSQKLTPKMKAELDKELGTIGIPAQAFDPFEPWFVSMTLTSLGAQKLGLKPELGPEGILIKAAKAEGKSIGELEGVEKQLSIMDAIPEATQIAAMGETLSEMPKLGEKFAPMLNAWSSGDTDELVKLLDEGEDKLPEFRKVMFTDRNAKWADWVSKRMEKPGVVFMAVGAGHLAGDDSVQSFLAKKGIKAERVKG